MIEQQISTRPITIEAGVADPTLQVERAIESRARIAEVVQQVQELGTIYSYAHLLSPWMGFARSHEVGKPENIVTTLTLYSIDELGESVRPDTVVSVLMQARQLHDPTFKMEVEKWQAIDPRFGIIPSRTPGGAPANARKVTEKLPLPDGWDPDRASAAACEQRANLVITIREYLDESADEAKKERVYSEREIITRQALAANAIFDPYIRRLMEYKRWIAQREFAEQYHAYLQDKRAWHERRLGAFIASLKQTDSDFDTAYSILSAQEQLFAEYPQQLAAYQTDIAGMKAKIERLKDAYSLRFADDGDIAKECLHTQIALNQEINDWLRQERLNKHLQPASAQPPQPIKRPDQPERRPVVADWGGFKKDIQDMTDWLSELNFLSEDDLRLWHDTMLGQLAERANQGQKITLDDVEQLGIIVLYSEIFKNPNRLMQKLSRDDPQQKTFVYVVEEHVRNLRQSNPISRTDRSPVAYRIEELEALLNQDTQDEMSPSGPVEALVIDEPSGELHLSHPRYTHAHRPARQSHNVPHRR